MTNTYLLHSKCHILNCTITLHISRNKLYEVNKRLVYFICDLFNDAFSLTYTIQHGMKDW
jgi:hypothetical protein